MSKYKKIKLSGEEGKNVEKEKKYEEEKTIDRKDERKE